MFFSAKVTTLLTGVDDGVPGDVAHFHRGPEQQSAGTKPRSPNSATVSFCVCFQDPSWHLFIKHMLVCPGKLRGICSVLLLNFRVDMCCPLISRFRRLFDLFWFLFGCILNHPFYGDIMGIWLDVEPAMWYLAVSQKWGCRQLMAMFNGDTMMEKCMKQWSWTSGFFDPIHLWYTIDGHF